MVKAYNDAILEAIEQLQPRAFVTVKGMYINPCTIERIARMGIATVNYYPDYHFDYPGLDISTLPLYSVVLTTKSFQISYLRQLVGAGRVDFLHHGYSDFVHVPCSVQPDERHHLADVSYVGNYSPHKEKWLRPIVRQLPGVRLRIVGSRWECGQDDDLKRCAIGHPLTGDFCARAMQYSRINVAVHGEPSRREGWQDFVSLRTFEIPACKGFMLHIDNDEIRQLFEPGREIDVFANEDELVAKLTYYLARPELRREMIERAYRRCVPAYGYNARAAAISRRIEALGEEADSRSKSFARQVASRISPAPQPP
jgi:spore maturation protein CgeB